MEVALGIIVVLIICGIAHLCGKESESKEIPIMEERVVNEPNMSFLQKTIRERKWPKEIRAILSAFVVIWFFSLMIPSKIEVKMIHEFSTKHRNPIELKINHDFEGNLNHPITFKLSDSGYPIKVNVTNR